MSVSKSVLIIDDSRLTRMIFAKVISSHYPNWEVSHAADGASALTVAAQKKFDFISLDHNMPDATGLDILPQLRELQPNALVGVFTANVQTVLLNRYESNGAHCYIKPLDEKMILTFINSEGPNE